jgi:asparagine synthase (glutamine-hydrolysing)
MTHFVAIVRDDGAPVDPALLASLAAPFASHGPVERRISGPFGVATALFRTDPEAAWEGAFARRGDVLVAGHVRLDAEGPPSGMRDVERIAWAYARGGDAVLDGLTGDFAFVLLDARARRLLAQRDAFGVRPCYYGRAGRAWILASEARCLLAHPALDAALDEASAGDFLLFGENRRLGSTFRRGIRRLPPGHRLTLDARGLRLARVPRPFASRTPSPRRPEEVVEAFGELLENAVRRRTPAYGVSILASGGLDSASVAAAAHAVQRRRGRPGGLRACHFAYRTSSTGEGEAHARAAADALSMPLDVELLDGRPLFPPHLLARTDPSGPVVDLLDPGDLYQRAARHARVLLTGHGGDPLLLSSPYHLARLLRRGRVAAALGGVLRHARQFHAPPRLGLRTWWRRRRADPDEGYPPWIAPSFALRLGLRERFRELSTPFAHAAAPGSGAEAALADTCWPNLFEGLTSSRELPVEVRHPFFDAHLVAFVLGLAEIPWRMDKTVLREAMRGRLPEAVRTRPKTPLPAAPAHPFPASHRRWLDARLRLAPDLASYVDVEILASMLDRAQRGDAEFVHRCLPAVAFGVWLADARRAAQRPSDAIPARTSEEIPSTPQSHSRRFVHVHA